MISSRGDSFNSFVGVILAMIVLLVSVVMMADRSVIGDEWEHRRADGSPMFMKRKHTWYNDPFGLNAKCERDYRYSVFEYSYDQEMVLCRTDFTNPQCAAEARILAQDDAITAPWTLKAKGCSYKPRVADERRPSTVSPESAGEIRLNRVDRARKETLTTMSKMADTPTVPEEECYSGHSGPNVPYTPECLGMPKGTGYLHLFPASKRYEALCTLGMWPKGSEVYAVYTKIVDEAWPGKISIFKVPEAVGFIQACSEDAGGAPGTAHAIAERVGNQRLG